MELSAPPPFFLLGGGGVELFYLPYVELIYGAVLILPAGVLLLKKVGGGVAPLLL